MAYIKDENGLLKGVLHEEEYDAIDRLWTASKYDSWGFIANCEKFGEFGDVVVDTEDEVIRTIYYGLDMLDANDLESLAKENYAGCTFKDIEILHQAMNRFPYSEGDGILPIDYGEFCYEIGYFDEEEYEEYKEEHKKEK